MDLSRAYNPVLRFADLLGHPLIGGMLYTYESGTDNPAATYRDARGTLNENPLALDAYGEACVWIEDGKKYRFVVKDGKGVTLLSQDNITSVTPYTKSETDGEFETKADAKSKAEAYGLMMRENGTNTLQFYRPSLG